MAAPGSGAPRECLALRRRRRSAGIDSLLPSAWPRSGGCVSCSVGCNLYDTNPGLPEPPASPPPYNLKYLTTRTADGSYNDLNDPRMGMAGQRFGRNVPISYTYPEPEPAILDPNPQRSAAGC